MFASSRTRIGLVVATLAAGVASGAAVAATSSDAPISSVCVSKSSGAVRVASSCRKSERRETLASSLAGPAGPAGAQGPAGTPGAPGKDGVNGKDGINGTPGKDGTPADLAPEPRHLFLASASGACQSGHYCGTYGAPSSLDVTHRPAASYFKTPDGIVHLEGAATSSGTPAAASTVVTLPAGYRPTGGRDFVVETYGPTPGIVEVSESGAVTVNTGGTSFVSLDGISFLP